MLGPISTLLEEKKLKDEYGKLLQMADRNGKQLIRLVNEILDLRKLELGKIKLNDEPTVLSVFFQKYLP